MQEVLERSVALIDQLSLDLERAQETITSQQDQITDLQRQIQALQLSKKSDTQGPYDDSGYQKTTNATPSMRLTTANRGNTLTEKSHAIDNTMATTRHYQQQTSPSPSRISNIPRLRPNDIREAVKSLALQDEQLLGQHDARIQGIRDFWAAKSAAKGKIPAPSNGKSPELVPSCKITMAARASTSGTNNIPTPRSLNNSNEMTRDSNEEE